MNSTMKLLIVSGAIVLVAGGMACNRDDDQVKYIHTPKEQREQGSQPVAEQQPQTTGAEEITWDVPAGWTRKPNAAEGMRYATFDAGNGLEVTVVPLGGEAGSVLANVNRWEGQLGLPATPEADLGKTTKELQTNAGPALTVDLTGPATAGKPAPRMLAAMVKHVDSTWFFKLTGPTDAVAKQTDNFTAFTKSTRFSASTSEQQASTPTAPPPIATPSAGSPENSALTYSTPPGWEKQGPRPMRDVWFKVAAGQAEVIVSRLPQGVGDLLSNVNRWRGQVGLPPVQDAGNVGEAITVDNAKGTLFDFAGPDKRQIVAMVNKGNSDWFIKIIGPKDAVSSEQPKFKDFLTSLKLAD